MGGLEIQSLLLGQSLFRSGRRAKMLPLFHISGSEAIQRLRRSRRQFLLRFPCQFIKSAKRTSRGSNRQQHQSVLKLKMIGASFLPRN